MKPSWEIKRLSEISDLKGRIGWRGLTAKEYTRSGPLFLSVHSLNYGDCIDFRDAFHISEERYLESPEIMLQTDDVLICKDGAGIGKVGIVGALPDRATINSSLLLIRARKSVLPNYLYRYLSSPQFQRIVSSQLNGATTPHLYQHDIAEFPIPIPPICEQRRIVAILDKALAAIATAKANTEKNLQNAQKLFERWAQEVFNPTTGIWTEKPLSELAKFRNGVNYTQQSNGERIQIVGVKDFQNNFWVPTTELETVKIDGRLSEIDTLKPGDLLVVRSNGNPKLIGRCIVANGVAGKLSHSGFTIRIRISGAEVIPEYLCHFMKRSGSRRLLVAGGTGTNIRSLNQQGLSRLLVRFPSISQQKALINKIESISQQTQRTAELYQQKLAALDELRKSLLHQGFAGAL